MERVCVTEAELIDAVRDAMSGADASDDGMTLGEMGTATGVGAKRLRLALRTLLDAGRLEVGRRLITSIDGRKCFVPVYRVKP